MATTEHKEITLVDIFEKVKAWFAWLWKKWLLILIVGILGGALGLLYAFFAKPTYTGSLTFVLSSNSNSGSLASLAGQFGINLGMSNDDAFAGDNIMELLRSQKIVKSALFRKIPGSDKVLINLIVEKAAMDKAWQAYPNLKNAYPFPDNADKLTPVQDSLVMELHEVLLKGSLNIERPDNKLSFYKVSTTSEDQNIACDLTNFVVEEASRFYIATKTKSAKDNLAMLQHETDSLQNLLGGAITNTASEVDKTFNLNPAYQVQRSGAQQGQFRATALAAAYSEVVKNLEIAKITLQRETPLYQLIDIPKQPLRADKPGKLTSLIIGGFLAGFLLVFFLTIKYIFKVSYGG